MRWAVLLISITLSPSLLPPVQAQVEPAADSLSRTNIRPLDTLTAARTGTLPKTYVPAKSPGTALLLSAILPGAGQVYNQSYWKVPVVLGFGVYFASQWLHNNRLYKDWRDRFTESLATTEGGNRNYLAVREFYKDQRDAFTWYFFILYILNLADAYVDASLFDFNVGSDLSIRVQPLQSLVPPRALNVGIQVTF